MGRKRLYANDAERQRAFQQRKKEKQLIELSNSRANSTETLSNIDCLKRIYPQYTFEQMKEAYEEYSKFYLKRGYDVALEADVDYEEKHKKPRFERENIVLVHGIPFLEMENNMDNTVVNECGEHGYRFRYSIFLDYCPKCLDKLSKKRSRCS